MGYQNINASISAEDIQEIKAALQTIQKKLPFHSNSRDWGLGIGGLRFGQHLKQFFPLPSQQGQFKNFKE
ncbi:MAG: hypothetical protein KA716_14315 [Gloeotrichia echinulata DEX184]|nr:hypothetical protein [Gloeotrichia echinulata DEX184]